MTITAKIKACSVLCGVVFLVAAHDICASEVSTTRGAIASDQKHELSVTLMNDSGRFVAGRNTFCVLFSRKESGKPATVTEVSVHFAQQVGKIREKPIISYIAQDQIGRYCGEVDLGFSITSPRSITS